MFKNSMFFLVTSLFSVLLSAATPFNSKTVIDLRKHVGTPCSAAMTDLLAPAMDKDLVTPFIAASLATVKSEAAKFDPAALKKLTLDFKDGEAGFNALVSALAGTQTTPETFRALIRSKLKELSLLKDPKTLGLTAAKLESFLGIASGAGVTVIFDDKTSCCHYGYKTGADQALDPKSGRTWVSAGDRNSLDPSDTYIMKEMKKYFDSTADLEPFLTSFFQFMIMSDGSGYSKLSALGQTLEGDVDGVFGAEQRRHWMTHLKSHPWEIDLASITLLSVFSTQSGYVMFKDNALVEGTPADYFGVSATPGNGSGLGITRRFRRPLQNKISIAMRTLHPDVTDIIDGITGAGPKDDIYQKFMEFIIDPANDAAVRKNGPTLVKAMTNYILLTRSDAANITKAIK